MLTNGVAQTDKEPIYKDVGICILHCQFIQPLKNVINKF